MIIFTDLNKSLVKKIKNVVETTINNLHTEIKVLNKDILKVKKEYPNALIVTASNPKFEMNGGIDKIIKDRYPSQCKNVREFKFTDDLFFTITCDNKIQSDKSIIKRALLGVYFASRKNDIILSGLGTSIAGLDEDEFVEEFKLFLNVDFRYANFRYADFENTDFYNADFRYADFENTDFYNADFRYADFRSANFRSADFRSANFRYADFNDTNFNDTDFYNADFRYANFRYADFRSADFRSANFRYADFNDTNFNDADFRYADFRSADFRSANFNYRILPEEGEITGWKKANDKIIKLSIDCKNAVGGMIGRKCRCKKAKVLDIYNLNMRKIKIKKIESDRNKSFIYEIGKTNVVEDWNNKPYLECEKGIHFFLTKQEAINY